jgi:multisubunit Na+/H+ antiporter MnhE subunit
VKNVNKFRRVIKTFGSSLPVFYLFWIVFVGTFSSHELMIGVVGAVLASVGLSVINLYYPARFSPTLMDLLSILRLPWYLISESWEITIVAIKDLVGIQSAKSLFRVVPFRAGDQDDPHATARRVLVVSYTTMSPNFIVLGVNTSDQKLLFHQIERTSIPKMAQQLGAQA